MKRTRKNISLLMAGTILLTFFISGALFVAGCDSDLNSSETTSHPARIYIFKSIVEYNMILTDVPPILITIIQLTACFLPRREQLISLVMGILFSHEDACYVSRAVEGVVVDRVYTFYCEVLHLANMVLWVRSRQYWLLIVELIKYIQISRQHCLSMVPTALKILMIMMFLMDLSLIRMKIF